MSRFNKKFTKTFVDRMGLAFLMSSASGKNEALPYKFTKEMPGIKGFPGKRKISSRAVICSAFPATSAEVVFRPLGAWSEMTAW